MGMDSYLELFTTMYGWFFNSIIWGVLSASGIIFIPFLVTLVQVWRDSHETADDADGAAQMIRRMEVELFSAIVVISLCLVPNGITSLASMKLYYEPTATTVEPNPRTATVAAPDSSYGSADAFGSAPAVAPVPPWWYTVMGLSSGVNAAVRTGIQGGIRDFRQLEDLAHIATVEDPQVRSSIQRFYSECFVPARSRYLAADARSPAAVAAIFRNGPADVDWMGSHAFRNDPTLYADLYARHDTPGFAYDPARDKDVNPAVAAPNQPKYGRPSCKEWWESTGGLRDQMASSIGDRNSFENKLKLVFTSFGVEELKDNLARMAYQKTAPTYIDSESMTNGIGNQQSIVDRVMRMPANIAGAAGTGWEAFKASASMKPLIYFMTISQPLILMAIYTFLPIIIVFSRYSLATMFVGAIAIFSVKFWTVMWYIARWLDDNLIAAMYPGVGGMALIEFLADNGTTENTMKRMVLNIVFMFMYIGLPILFSGMMAWIGINVGQGVQKMLGDAVSGGRQAGNTGAKIGSSVAGKLRI